MLYSYQRPSDHDESSGASSAAIYSAVLRRFDHRLIPVSTVPPAQLLHRRVTPGGPGHEFVLNYYRWHVRLQLIPRPEQPGGPVDVIVGLREAGVISRLAHGIVWHECFRYRFDVVPDAIAIDTFLAELEAQLKDRRDVRAVRRG